MRKTVWVLSLSSALSMIAFAESFTGNLLDDTCYQTRGTPAGCYATGGTTTFALDVSGEILKLDDSGNQKAAAAVRKRADRAAADPDQPHSTTVLARVEGTESGGTIAIESIELQ